MLRSEEQRRAALASSLQEALRALQLCSLRAAQVWRFVLTVEKNYAANPYHNFAHGFSVLHMLWLWLQAEGAAVLTVREPRGTRRLCALTTPLAQCRGAETGGVLPLLLAWGPVRAGLAS